MPVLGRAERLLLWAVRYIEEEGCHGGWCGEAMGPSGEVGAQEVSRKCPRSFRSDDDDRAGVTRSHCSFSIRTVDKLSMARGRIPACDATWQVLSIQSATYRRGSANTSPQSARDRRVAADALMADMDALDASMEQLDHWAEGSPPAASKGTAAKEPIASWNTACASPHPPFNSRDDTLHPAPTLLQVLPRAAHPRTSLLTSRHPSSLITPHTLPLAAHS